MLSKAWFIAGVVGHKILVIRGFDIAYDFKDYGPFSLET